MFERFSGEARQVVVVAQEEARGLQHHHIGTEHLLLGLFSAPESAAGRVLSHFGLTKETVIDDVLAAMPRGDADTKGHIPFTKRAKKVMELALREALSLNHSYIGTEHILLGIVREGSGLGATILTSHTPGAAAVRGAVLSQVGRGQSEDAPAVRSTPRRTTAAEEVVAAAQALAGDAPMGSHHLLEALIRTEGSMAAQVLAGIGVDPDTIADKVDELDPEATTDATPEEAAVRKMSLRLDGDEVHLVFTDEATLHLAREVITAYGGPVSPQGPLIGVFVPLWTQLNQALSSLGSTMTVDEAEDDDSEKVSTLVRRVIRSRMQGRRRPPNT